MEQTTAVPQQGAAPDDEGQQKQALIGAHRKIVLAAMKILYSGDDVVNKMVSMVQSAEDPAQGLKDATTVILDQVASKMTGNIHPDFAYSAAQPVAVAIAQLAVTAGVIPDDLKIVQGALELMMNEAKAGAEAPAEEPQQPPAEAPAEQVTGRDMPVKGIVQSQMGG